MAGKLAIIDYAILAVYLIGTVALGVTIGRRVKTGKDYFLAGRSLPWWAIGMSLVATDIGGTDIIGVGGAAYSHGLAVANFEWIGCVPAMIVGAFVFIPIFWKLGIYTIPEYMEKRFDVGVRSALAITWLIFMACNLGIMLFASAKMMNVLLGWNVTACVFLTAALVGVYTLAGGLAAVVYTDVIQCAVMIGGCLLALGIGVADLGGVGGMLESVRAIEAARDLPEGRMTDLILPADADTPFPWTGILFGLALILSPAYWIGNQAIVQRSLGAKSEFAAKASYIWGALLKNLIPLIVAVPGLIALAKFPDLADGDNAFPTLVAELFPAGLRGLFLAAFIAALMSSVDSYLNASATIVTNDFYKRLYNAEASEGRILFVGRIVTGALLLWAVVFAFVIARIENMGIYAIFQTLMAFFQGPALALLLTGLLWRRANAKGAFVGFIGGVGFSILLYALGQEGVQTALGIEPLFKVPDPFLFYSIWAFVVSLALIVVVSLATPPESDEKLRNVVWHFKKGANE